ncbi:MAG: hypothetical protein ACI3ZP_04440 [Candidatus Cryptobacteroides sp.]
MRTYIKVSDSLRNKLAQHFRISRVSVWSALNYLTHSKLSDEVRRYALENGGSIEEEDFMPNCRTEHTDDEIIQTFAGGIKVRMSKVNSAVTLFQDDKEMEHYEGMTLQAWGNLLYHAQTLSEKRISSIRK